MPENKRVRHGDCVVFRRYPDGQIIALFPYDFVNEQGDCNSYMFIGEHGAADYFQVLSDTVRAAPKDYESLCKYLKSRGYKPRIMERAHSRVKRLHRYIQDRSTYDARCDRR